MVDKVSDLKVVFNKSKFTEDLYTWAVANTDILLEMFYKEHPIEDYLSQGEADDETKL